MDWSSARTTAGGPDGHGRWRDRSASSVGKERKAPAPPCEQDLQCQRVRGSILNGPIIERAVPSDAPASMYVRRCWGFHGSASRAAATTGALNSVGKAVLVGPGEPPGSALTWRSTAKACQKCGHTNAAPLRALCTRRTRFLLPQIPPHSAVW